MFHLQASGSTSKRRAYEKTLAENVELQTQLQLAHTDTEALRKEVAKVLAPLTVFRIIFVAR